MKKIIVLTSLIVTILVSALSAKVEEDYALVNIYEFHGKTIGFK